MAQIKTKAITDDAVGLAQMAVGTDGNIISYDASTNPVAIATGSDGQVLTSTGAGSPPAFEAIPSGGKILQVKQTSGATVTTISATTYALHMSAPAITPSATSSKILIMHSAPALTLSNTSNMGHATLYRGSTNITTGGHGSSFATYQGGSPLTGTNIIYLDSPSSTSALTYSVYVKTDNTGLTMVYGYNSGQPRASTITVMEIGV